MVDKNDVFDFEEPLIELENKLESLRLSSRQDGTNVSGEITDLEQQYELLKKELYSSLKPWQRVQIARHQKRPYTLDYVKLIFDDFIELHGDRVFADDKAMICGFATLDEVPVAVMGHQKGRDIKENMDRNFAMAHPEGYRKALRVMKLAEKFGCPIISFIDTPGAYPGIAAEERGQAEAIARNLREMADLKTPVLGVIIGEGGSGGALGIGVANRILMLENSYYSVISPEGCAAILFNDPSKAEASASALKITARDLFETGVVDEIIREPAGGAHRDLKATAETIKVALIRNLIKFEGYSGIQLAEDRYNKYRKLGVFIEATSKKTASKNKTIKIQQ